MRVAWNPRALRGSGRIEKARLWGLYVAASAAGYLGSLAAVARREGDAPDEDAEVGKGGLDEERPATVAARREAAVSDEQRETKEYEGGTGGEDGEVGAGGPDAQGGEGARRAGATRGSYPAGAPNNHTGGHSAVPEEGGCAGPYLEGLPSCGGSRPLVRVWLQGPEGWCQWRVGGMDGLQRVVHTVWGAPVGTWWLVRGGRVLRSEEESLFEDDHIQVRFGEPKSGKGKEKQQEEKEEPIPPISVANVVKMEAAPHLPRWMSGQCKLLRDLLGGLGEEWVAEDMEGVEGGEGGGGSGLRNCLGGSGGRGDTLGLVCPGDLGGHGSKPEGVWRQMGWF